MYLVDVSADSWAHDGYAGLLDAAFAARDLPAWTGPPGPGGRFEEKLIPSMDAFAELCARHGAAEFLDASLFVPVDFAGLIELPRASSFDDVTNVFSAQRLRAAIAPIAAGIALPAGLPSGPMALTNAVDDPLVFYVALFQQAAEFSVGHGRPLTYV